MLTYEEFITAVDLMDSEMARLAYDLYVACYKAAHN